MSAPRNSPEFSPKLGIHLSILIGLSLIGLLVSLFTVGG
jgi:hypothetical protein